MLYDVELSVLDFYQRKNEKFNWQDKWRFYLNSNKNQIYKNFVNKIQHMLPCINNFELIGFLQGPRVVLANKNRTDQRRTSVTMPIKNYFNVFGGKVDHIFFAFKEIEKHLIK